jgi:hypothetical protein
MMSFIDARYSYGLYAQHRLCTDTLPGSKAWDPTSSGQIDLLSEAHCIKEGAGLPNECLYVAIRFLQSSVLKSGP